jgi:UDP-N-acetylmuramoyl-tripeptide--D-alanyl-D-alanine ligase
MRFSATALAEVLGGRLVGPDVTVNGVATNTRELQPGQLFVPLRDRRDGHAFINDALAAGAVAYLTDGATASRGTAIVVADTALALTEIGRTARQRIRGHVVGITGSVGKTTVKDLTSSAFSSTFHTQASHLSFNNEIGLPLTLANADDDVEVVVAELGARGPGHIAALCDVAQPTIGIITRIGLAHTEFFGTLEQVAVAKAELFEALPPDGVAVLNGDDAMASMIGDRSSAPVLLFGTAGHCDVVARDVILNEHAQPVFQMTSPWGDAEVHLAVHGEHQVLNALAALTSALWAGVAMEQAVDAIARVEDPPWRMNLKWISPGIVLVNDAYNANPTSTEAALRALNAMSADRRIAILGGMAELGPGSDELHAGIRTLAESLGIVVIGYQTPAYGDDFVSSLEELIDRLHGFRTGDAFLVKGSRATGMESVAASLESAITAASETDGGPG